MAWMPTALGLLKGRVIGFSISRLSKHQVTILIDDQHNIAGSGAPFQDLVSAP